MIAKIFLFSFSFFVLSVQDINPIFYLIAFYVLSFLFSRRLASPSLNIFSLSIFGIVLAWIYSFLVAVYIGNNIYFAFRYSGGLLVIPLYFVLSKCSLARLTILLRYIIIGMFLISLSSVVYLAVNIVNVDSLIKPLRFIIGVGSGSGYEDTRYYSLTLVSAVIPTSILFIVSPNSLRCFFPKLFSYSFTPVVVRILGFLFGFSSQMLLFTKSYLIYLFVLLLFAFCSSLSAIQRCKFNIFSILSLSVVSIILPIASYYVLKEIDVARLYSLLDSFNYESNTQRYEQIKYIVDNFNLFGSGLGASFENTPLLRSHSAPYGLENSLINLFHKFGISILLFIPFLFVVFRCFWRIVYLTPLINSNFAKLNHLGNLLDILLLLNILLPACAYFILFSVGNPVLFHIQLNFLLVLIFSIYSHYEPSMRLINNQRC